MIGSCDTTKSLIGQQLAHILNNKELEPNFLFNMVVTVKYEGSVNFSASTFEAYRTFIKKIYMLVKKNLQ